MDCCTAEHCEECKRLLNGEIDYYEWVCPLAECEDDIHMSRTSKCQECFCDHNKQTYVAPIVHARWEEIITGDSLYVVTICSNCKGDVPIDYEVSPIWKYCPHCGARMDM